ncbi:MAG: hypothetical protein L0227_13315 [Chloroflexi bacterium]|nr:hypothetical protein [Chloroflexota bacterium]
MTHEYTLLLGGTVLPGGDLPPCEAVAWADATILAVGTREEVEAVSRGDSRRLSADGAFVVPLGPPLEVGGRADLAVLVIDPRLGDPGPPRAVVRAGGSSTANCPDWPWHCRSARALKYSLRVLTSY